MVHNRNCILQSWISISFLNVEENITQFQNNENQITNHQCELSNVKYSDHPYELHSLQIKILDDTSYQILLSI